MQTLSNCGADREEREATLHPWITERANKRADLLNSVATMLRPTPVVRSHPTRVANPPPASGALASANSAGASANGTGASANGAGASANGVGASANPSSVMPKKVPMTPVRAATRQGKQVAVESGRSSTVSRVGASPGMSSGRASVLNTGLGAPMTPPHSTPPQLRLPPATDTGSDTGSDTDSGSDGM